MTTFNPMRLVELYATPLNSGLFAVDQDGDWWQVQVESFGGGVPVASSVSRSWAEYEREHGRLAPALCGQTLLRSMRRRRHVVQS